MQKDATGKASVFNPIVKLVSKSIPSRPVARANILYPSINCRSSAQANGAAPEHPNKRAKKDVAAPVEKEKVDFIL